MGRILKPLVRGGGWYPSNKWIPLVKNGGYTTQSGGGDEPEPPTPEVWKTASGAIASFVTSVAYPMRRLVAEINPVQDLHGYDAPYPAGGGKQLIPYPYSSASQTTQGVTFTVNSDGSIHVVSTGTGTSTAFFNLQTASSAFTLKAGTYTLGTGAANVNVVCKKTPNTSFINSGTNTGTGTLTEDTPCYCYLSCASTVAYDVTIKPMLNAGSTAETFAPYSNVCPISGWTGLSGQRTGVNVWDEEWVNGRWAGNNGVLNPGFYTYVACKNKIPVKPNTTYYLCVGSSVSTGREIVWYDINGDWIGDGPNTYVNGTFTTPSNVYFITFNLGGGYGATYNNDVSINYPSTDTSYHAYTGEAISVSFGQTVYGGTDEVISGNGVSDMGIIDLGTLNWTQNSNYPTVYQASLSGVKDQTSRLLCSAYATQAQTSISDLYNQSGDCIVCLRAGRTETIILKNTTATDAASLKTSLSGVMLCYELATPQSFTHTGQSVDTLLGQNNVWVDTGSIEVEYLESGTPTVVT